MKRQVYIFLVFASFAMTFVSCKSVQLADMIPTGKNGHLLPNLEPVADIFSFQNIFPSYYSYEPGSDVTVTNFDTISMSTTHTYTTPSVNYFHNINFYRTITFFERDVEENICNSFGPKKGTISCKILAYTNSSKSEFLKVPSLLSVFFLNFLGMPYCFNKSEIQLELTIFDLNNNKIAQYIGYGNGYKPVAFYYGYSLVEVDEQTTLSAFRMAMNDIKAQIEKDSEILIEKLNN